MKPLSSLPFLTLILITFTLRFLNGPEKSISLETSGPENGGGRGARARIRFNGSKILSP